MDKTSLILQINSWDELKNNLDTISEQLETNSVVLIRGLINPEPIKNGIKKLIENYNISNDTHLDPKNEVEDWRQIPNHQRFMAGEWGENETDRSFLYRIFTNPLWQDDVYGLHNTFKELAKLRNILYKLPENYAISDTQDDLWTHSRIQHYPRGGGFLCSHQDQQAFQNVAQSGFESYIQVLLMMSDKGKHFEKGGGYMVHEGKRVILEDFSQIGDIAIYNGQTLHGVEAIDRHRSFHHLEAKGRFSGLVTFYRTPNSRNK